MIQEISEQSAAIGRLCKRFCVRRLDLFGSAATGAFDPRTSDLDFLIEFESPLPIGHADAYFGLLEELERLLHSKVDLVVSGAVRNPYLKESIEKSRMLLYAA
jgi:uncharacterized protein